MKFKIKRVATPRQLLKAKYTIGMVVGMLGVQMATKFFASADDQEWNPNHGPHEYFAQFPYHSKGEYLAPTGRIVYYSDEPKVCDR